MSIEELLVLLDWLVSNALGIENINLTHGESLRLLAHVKELGKRAQAEVARRWMNLDPMLGMKLSRLVNETIPEFIEEANCILTPIGEETRERDREPYKRIWFLLSVGWDSLKGSFLLDPGLNVRFLELKARPDKVYPIVGFVDSTEFRENIWPTFLTLRKSATLTQRRLLARLLADNNINVKAMEEYGFDKVDIIETVNCLLRSKMLRSGESAEFVLTPLGREILEEFLNTEVK